MPQQVFWVDLRRDCSSLDLYRAVALRWSAHYQCGEQALSAAPSVDADSVLVVMTDYPPPINVELHRAAA